MVVDFTCICHCGSSIPNVNWRGKCLTHLAIPGADGDVNELDSRRTQLRGGDKWVGRKAE